MIEAKKNTTIDYFALYQKFINKSNQRNMLTYKQHTNLTMMSTFASLVGCAYQYTTHTHTKIYMQKKWIVILAQIECVQIIKTFK